MPIHNFSSLRRFSKDNRSRFTNRLSFYCWSLTILNHHTCRLCILRSVTEKVLSLLWWWVWKKIVWLMCIQIVFLKGVFNDMTHTFFIFLIPFSHQGFMQRFLYIQINRKLFDVPCSHLRLFKYLLLFGYIFKRIVILVYHTNFMQDGSISNWQFS